MADRGGAGTHETNNHPMDVAARKTKAMEERPAETALTKHLMADNSRAGGSPVSRNNRLNTDRTPMRSRPKSQSRNTLSAG